MQQVIEADEQKKLLEWLKEQGVTFSRPLFLLSALALAGFILQLVLFWYLSVIAQSVIVEATPPLPHLIAVLAGVMLVLTGIERIRLHLSENLEVRLYGHLQSKLFERLSRGQYALVRQQSTYSWQQFWLAHLPIISQFHVRYLVQQRFVVCVPVVILVCAFAINWLVGLSLFISLPVVPLFMFLVGKGAANLHRKHFKALTRLGGIFVDRIKSLELLRIFNAHERQGSVLAAASSSLNERTMKVVGVAFLSASVLEFFSTLAVALVAVFVGFNLLGEFTVGGQLTLHTGLFLLLASPLCFSELKQLGRLYHLRAEAIAAADELAPVLSQPHPRQHVVDANEFTQVSWHSLTLQNPPIQAQTLHFKKGDWVLLEGASGSGKTCFLECLMGQREGSHALQNAVLISQQAVVLPVSIKDNLSLGGHYSNEQLYTALTQVELDSWLKQQKNGLNTVLDEQIPLSGGQKQRLGLARALLSHANVVLLDEPTAHLTDEQHQRLSEMIRTTLQDKTVIWASHKALPASWFCKRWQMSDGILR